MSENRASEGTPSPATPAPTPANDNMPHGDLTDQLRFCASALHDAVNGDELADEAAEWFNLGFMATAANVMREAVAEIASTRSALREAQEDTRRINLIESGEVEIECMGTTVPYQWARGKGGDHVAIRTDMSPKSLRQVIDAAAGNTTP